MKRRKVVGMLLAVTVVAGSILSGCGSEGGGNESSESAGGESKVSESGQSTAASGGSEAEESKSAAGSRRSVSASWRGETVRQRKGPWRTTAGQGTSMKTVR